MREQEPSVDSLLKNTHKANSLEQFVHLWRMHVKLLYIQTFHKELYQKPFTTWSFKKYILLDLMVEQLAPCLPKEKTLLCREMVFLPTFHFSLKRIQKNTPYRHQDHNYHFCPNKNQHSLTPLSVTQPRCCSWKINIYARNSFQLSTNRAAVFTEGLKRFFP